MIESTLKERPLSFCELEPLDGLPKDVLLVTVPLLPPELEVGLLKAELELVCNVVGTICPLVRPGGSTLYADHEITDIQVSSFSVM